MFSKNMKQFFAAFLVMLMMIIFASPAMAQHVLSEKTDENPFKQADADRLERIKSFDTKPADLGQDKLKSLVDEKKRQAESAQSQMNLLAYGEDWLVKYNENASLQAIYESLTGLDYRVIGPSESRMIRLLTRDIEQYKSKAENMIEHVEANGRFNIDQLDPISVSEHTDGTPVMTQSIAVNDPYYSLQWAHMSINVQEAWNYSLGNPAVNSETIYVAVIDSGIDRYHSDLNDADIRAGWDYLYGGDVMFDTAGHGTNVTGIITAETNNATGIAGVCWNMAIIPLLVSDSDGANTSTIIEAIMDSVAIGVKVINISLGSTTYSSLLEDAIEYAAGQGCIVVASAGNDGTSDLKYPASCAGAISVGSVNQSHQHSLFSNFNSSVDFVAPGESIVTTADATVAPYESYLSMSGTSFSAPHVTAVAALAKTLNPLLTTDTFEHLLRLTSTDLGSAGYDNYYGYGLVNAGYLMQALTYSNVPAIHYQSHVENIGWQGWKWNGDTSGTSGQSLRLEAIRIGLQNIDGGVAYRTHVQDIGWMDYVNDDALSGTEGRSLRLEAINIALTGAAASTYDVYYRVHAENIGWMDWAKNGAPAGSAGYSYRLEAIEIILVDKNGPAPGPTTTPYVERNLTPPAVVYQSHIQDIGWQDWVRNGSISGTNGQSLRMEAIRIGLENINGGIEYQSHVAEIGWMDPVVDKALSGTEGLSLRLEAINIHLTGDAASLFDIYYRVHVENFGWLDWAKNGLSAGSAGYAYRLEAIEIVLVPKNEPAPGPTATPFHERIR